MLPPIEQFLDLASGTLPNLDFLLELLLAVPVLLQRLGVGHASLGMSDALEHLFVLCVDLFGLFAVLYNVERL